MSKGKPRHNPEKPQNKLGRWCAYCEKLPSGGLSCEIGRGKTDICNGNPHNCIKTKFHNLASLGFDIIEKHNEHNNGRTDTRVFRSNKR